MIRHQGIASRFVVIAMATAMLAGCKAKPPGSQIVGFGGAGAGTSSAQTLSPGGGGQTTTSTTGSAGGGGGGIGPRASLTGPPGTGNRALLMFDTNKFDTLIGGRSTNDGIEINVSEDLGATTGSASFTSTPSPIGGALPGTGQLIGDAGNLARSTNRYTPGVITTNTELLVSSSLGPAIPFGPDELLSDANYGLVLVEGTTPATIYVGGFHTGNVTPVSQIPSANIATYNGRFLGRHLSIGGSTAGIIQIAGDTAITANFGTGNVNGIVINLTDAFGNTAGYGLAMNGTISGAGYTGTAQYTDLAGNAAGTATNSALNGAFYGANAAETAGAILLEGNLPAGATPVVGTPGESVALFGAFGAKK